MYAWQRQSNVLTLEGYFDILEQRRQIMLDSLEVCAPEDYSDAIVTEWIELLNERNKTLHQLFKQKVEQVVLDQLLSIHSHLCQLLEYSREFGIKQVSTTRESNEITPLPTKLYRSLSHTFHDLVDYFDAHRDLVGTDFQKGIYCIPTKQYNELVAQRHLEDREDPNVVLDFPGGASFSPSPPFSTDPLVAAHIDGWSCVAMPIPTPEDPAASIKMPRCRHSGNMPVLPILAARMKGAGLGSILQSPPGPGFGIGCTDTENATVSGDYFSVRTEMRSGISHEGSFQGQNVRGFLNPVNADHYVAGQPMGFANGHLPSAGNPDKNGLSGDVNNDNQSNKSGSVD